MQSNCKLPLIQANDCCGYRIVSVATGLQQIDAAAVVPLAVYCSLAVIIQSVVAVSQKKNAAVAHVVNEILSLLNIMCPYDWLKLQL